MASLSAAQRKARAIAKGGTRILTGDRELDAKLGRLKLSAANKIARRGMVKALRIILKSMKGQVPSNYKDAKRALGFVFDRKGGAKRDQVRAKVGASVGKASKAAAKKRKSKGVGITGANIHLMILGTDQRTRRSGLSTGAMPPILPDIVKGGFAAAGGTAMAAIREAVTTGLAKEAAKK